MIIHVVRHAEAVERSQDISDEHRFLTPRGRKRFTKIAKTLRDAGITPDLILTSPLVRAVQTADILADVLRYKGELPVAPLLAPGFRPKALDRLLDPYPQATEVVLVGHEPDVGILAQHLLAADERCTLKKGMVISFERTAGDKGEADFLFLVTGGGKLVDSRKKALARLKG